MAVDDEANRWSRSLLLCGLTIACALPAAARADGGVEAAGEQSAPVASAPRGWWWRDGASRLQGLVRNVKQRVRGDEEPDWLHLGDPAMTSRPTSNGDVYLVLQDERSDGTDLLTARYTLHDRGALRAYAGAGLNRVQYFQRDSEDVGPTLFNKRNRHTSMGVAAEVGAEMRMSQRVRLNADVRWLQLDPDAEAIRTVHGPIAADPLLFGLSVGYRFR
jgi:opacity protein-like surface antigen